MVAKSLNNSQTTKQRIIRFITGSPAMLRQTEAIYQQVYAFYLNVIHYYVEELPHWNKKTGTKTLEQLTVATEPRINSKTGELFGGNASPLYPIDEVAKNFPAYLRRAIIMQALGQAKSWHSNYNRWQKKRENVAEKNQRRIAAGKKPITFDAHPPQYPLARRVGITYYKGAYQKLNFENNTMELKAWDGKNWAYLTVEVERNTHVDKYHKDPNWHMTVPTLYENGGLFTLHTSFERKEEVIPFAEYYQQPDTNVMSIDMNMGQRNRAVCSLVGKDGTVHAVKHIGMQACNTTTNVHHLLGLIARNTSKLGTVPKDHHPNKKLWRKVKAVNDNYAHHLSKRIVELANEWGVRVIVFENLRHFSPDKKARGSRKMRQRQSYWLHRRVIKYTTYKAKASGILIALINPKYTSQRCSLCGSLDTTRPRNNELRCHICNTVHNSHINASINIGWAWFLREHQRANKQRTAS